jgi:hypothetical protein
MRSLLLLDRLFEDEEFVVVIAVDSNGISLTFCLKMFLCFLPKAMGHPDVQAGLSPMRIGNSYTVISRKETDDDDDDAVEVGPKELLERLKEERGGTVEVDPVMVNDAVMRRILIRRLCYSTWKLPAKEL